MIDMLVWFLSFLYFVFHFLPLLFFFGEIVFVLEFFFLSKNEGNEIVKELTLSPLNQLLRFLLIFELCTICCFYSLMLF